MIKKIVTEREGEKLVAKNHFALALPKKSKQALSEKYLLTPAEKTSLFVSKQLLFQKAEMRPSGFSPEVLVTRKLPAILEAIFKYGDVALRYGPTGLENDPTRQQIIIYSMVVCQNHLLWYQRAGKEELSNRPADKLLGDSRLRGRYSVGFGGHKTEDDIKIGRQELVFLDSILPAIKNEVGLVSGLNKGLFSEVEEELGLARSQIKNLRLLGAFYDGRFENPLVDVQVGWVHTGIAAVLEVDSEQAQELVFNDREIARAWWVPFEKVVSELDQKITGWRNGKGPKVENWTEIMIREFWSEYLVGQRTKKD